LPALPPRQPVAADANRDHARGGISEANNNTFTAFTRSTSLHAVNIRRRRAHHHYQQQQHLGFRETTSRAMPTPPTAASSFNALNRALLQKPML
jgi:hypothetical protein